VWWPRSANSRAIVLWTPPRPYRERSRMTGIATSLSTAMLRVIAGPIFSMAAKERLAIVTR
jgi:hypothetical protein